MFGDVFNFQTIFFKKMNVYVYILYIHVNLILNGILTIIQLFFHF